MNKYLNILIVLFVYTNARSQSNIYHPFPEDTATWVVDHISNTCSGGNSYCFSYVYKMKGDTLINGISYNKIYRRQVKFYYISTPPNPVVGTTVLTPDVFWSGIRQEINNKKVYIFDHTLNADTLLYDFDLQIGDTLPQTYLQNALFSSTVTAIDSILISGQYNKVFHFNNTTNTIFVDNLIEGIGSVGSLTFIYDFFESGPRTVCFNGNGIAGETIWGSCALYQTVSILEIKLNGVWNVFSNPFSSFTTLSSNIYMDNIRLCVIDFSGKTIKELNALSGQTIILDRDNLPAGIYVIHLFNNGQIFSTNKILITDD